MSNLKKDITQILANLYSQAYADGAVGHSRSADILTAHKKIINLIESVVDSVSPSKYQTPTSYKKAIKSRLIGEE